MLTILSANINVFADGILVGKYIGADALAAVNLSLPLYLALCVAGSFLASGSAINAARAIGCNETDKSRMYYSVSVFAALFVSVLITVSGLACKDAVAGFLCSDESIRPYVMEYVVITLIGAAPRIMIYIPFWYLRLDGKNRAVTVMMLVMSVGNVILDILFVYALDMGVFGAGLASVAATTAALVMGFVKLFEKGSSFKLKIFPHSSIRDWRAIAVMGTPSALNNLLSTLRLLLINTMLMRYGGGSMVAVFSAVNGIAGFGECITLGIPQAASVMLGVYSGEEDNGSCILLIRLEWMTGCVCAGIFFIICMTCAGVIRQIYGLSESLVMPLFWMVVSVFPALLCNILSGYYNMAKKSLWSNGIIVSRVLVMTYAGLLLVISLRLQLYFFMFFAEGMTIILWFLASGIRHRIDPGYTRYLLMDMSLEKSGRVLNFSVISTAEDICGASERIMEFCAANGMDRKKTMCIQLAIEEIMTLITQVNKGTREGGLKFDLRAYSLRGATGIRIRYAGLTFNPFNSIREDDELYMGIIMILKMVERTNYQRAFGVNMLQVVMREE